MAVKVNRHKKVFGATRIFTDREETRAAFWDNFNFLSSNMNKDIVKVLCFYGMGGIGKTTLCKELLHEIEDFDKEIKYSYFDLSDVQEDREILTRIKNEYERKYKYRFPFFDYALFFYSLKRGEKVDKPEIKGIIESSSFLSRIFEMFGFIPGASAVSSIIKSTDAAMAVLKNFFYNNKNFISEIEKMDLIEIKKRLPEYFATDMMENMKDENKPIVIFFDTYEMLVNEMCSIGEPLMNDLWLRGISGIDSKYDGLITSIPNVLWVISGREKLKWEDINSAWDKESLEQYILGDLTENDSLSFLKNAGIQDIKLCNELYKLTNGMPVYLDLCIDIYYAKLNNDEEPQIDDFVGGIEMLVERFIRYMGDNEKIIVFLLACMSKWTDSEFDQVNKILHYNVSPILYDKIKSLSFILSEDGITYFMHQKVQDIIYNKCPISIVQDYQEYLNSKIEDEYIETDKKSQLIMAKTILITRAGDSKSLIEDFNSIKENFEVLLENKDYKKFEKLFLYYWELLKNTDTIEYVVAAILYIKYNIEMRKYNDAIDIIQKCEKATALDLLGYKDKFDFYILSGNVFMSVHEFSKAYKAHQFIYDYLISTLGEGEIITKKAYDILQNTKAHYYMNNGDYKRYIEIVLASESLSNPFWYIVDSLPLEVSFRNIEKKINKMYENIWDDICSGMLSSGNLLYKTYEFFAASIQTNRLANIFIGNLISINIDSYFRSAASDGYSHSGLPGMFNADKIRASYYISKAFKKCLSLNEKGVSHLFDKIDLIKLSSLFIEGEADVLNYGETFFNNFSWLFNDNICLINLEVYIGEFNFTLDIMKKLKSLFNTCCLLYEFTIRDKPDVHIVKLALNNNADLEYAISLSRKRISNLNMSSKFKADSKIKNRLGIIKETLVMAGFTEIDALNSLFSKNLGQLDDYYEA